MVLVNPMLLEPLIRMVLPAIFSLSRALFTSSTSANRRNPLPSAAVAGYKPQNNRSQLTETGRNHLVVDAYNANPTSMAAAIDNFSMIQAPDKMLILGDMRELGDVSQAEHTNIVDMLKRKGFTQVWLVGSEFGKAAQGAGFRLFPDVEAVNVALSKEPVAGKTILIKGSNSIGLTKTITNL